MEKDGMKEYSVRRNLNRGYMKLDVWHKSVELYRVVWCLVNEAKLDFKLRSQIADAAQPVSANIAEGYSRRSINEYMQHLYISFASLSETLSRAIAFLEAGQITRPQFQELDVLHYEVENKLCHLPGSLEQKKGDGSWINKVSEETMEYKP